MRFKYGHLYDRRENLHAILFDLHRCTRESSGIYRVSIYARAPITPDQAQAILSGDAGLGTATIEAARLNDYADADQISVAQAATLLGVSVQRVRQIVGRINSAKKVGRAWVIDAHALIDFAARPRKVGRRKNDKGLTDSV